MVGRAGGREGGGHELVRPVGFVKEVKLKKCGIFDPLPRSPITIPHHMNVPPPRTSPRTNQPKRCRPLCSITLHNMQENSCTLHYKHSLSRNFNKISSPRAHSKLRFCIC